MLAWGCVPLTMPRLPRAGPERRCIDLSRVPVAAAVGAHRDIDDRTESRPRSPRQLVTACTDIPHAGEKVGIAGRFDESARKHPRQRNAGFLLAFDASDTRSSAGIRRMACHLR